MGLWSILIDVSNYSEWQPKVEKVTIQEQKDNQTVFVEHSTRKRHTVIIHHERAVHKCLLRILEERPSIDGQKKVPTFSGSWTFEIIQDKEAEDQVTLKITEQGVIKKPIVRVTHMLLFGFHRRIDRFINDLQALIAKENDKHSNGSLIEEKAQQQNEPASHSEQQKTDATAEAEKVLIGEQEVYQSTVLPNEQNTVAKPKIVSLDEGLPDNNTTQATADGPFDQKMETNDTLMTESKLVSGWDFVSEVYERPSVEST
ncbi:hypothetical protein PS6_002833 [Mucor atramentarius]